MKILLDHNVTRRVRPHLSGHEVTTTRERGWDRLANGLLLRTAADSGFEVFLTLDKKMEHEQNLSTLPLPIVLLDVVSNKLEAILPVVPAMLRLLENSLDRSLYVIGADSSVTRIVTPCP